jgi:hypothetical protein
LEPAEHAARDRIYTVSGDFLDSSGFLLHGYPRDSRLF